MRTIDFAHATVTPGCRSLDATYAEAGVDIQPQGSAVYCERGYDQHLPGTVVHVGDHVLSPSAAAKPMHVITDEYAAIAVEGYELVLTQLRARGIIGAIGNQDYSGLIKGGGDKGAGPAAAGQILGNTGLKLALRTADPRET